MVFCLLINASVFACVIHELEWFVSNVWISESICIVVRDKNQMFFTVFFCGGNAMKSFYITNRNFFFFSSALKQIGCLGYFARPPFYADGVMVKVF